VLITSTTCVAPTERLLSGRNMYMRRLITRWLPCPLSVIPILCGVWALSPKARAGCGKPARPDPWRGSCAIVIPTPTLRRMRRGTRSDRLRSVRSDKSKSGTLTRTIWPKSARSPKPSGRHCCAVNDTCQACNLSCTLADEEKSDPVAARVWCRTRNNLTCLISNPS